MEIRERLIRGLIGDNAVYGVEVRTLWTGQKEKRKGLENRRK